MGMLSNKSKMVLKGYDGSRERKCQKYPKGWLKLKVVGGGGGVADSDIIVRNLAWPFSKDRA